MFDVRFTRLLANLQVRTVVRIYTKARSERTQWSLSARTDQWDTSLRRVLAGVSKALMRRPTGEWSGRYGCAPDRRRCDLWPPRSR